MRLGMAFQKQCFARAATAQLRVPLSLVLGIAWASFALPACSDDDVLTKVGELTEKCTHDSDCDGELVCIYELCHTPCKSNEDCDNGVEAGRCVQSDQPGVFVCLFTEESECSFGAASASCVDSLECAIDNQCRADCDRTVDCPKAQVCSEDRLCAEEEAVDEHNNIVGPVTVDSGGPISNMPDGKGDGGTISPPDAGSIARSDAGADVSIEAGLPGNPETPDASTPQEDASTMQRPDAGAPQGFDFVEPDDGTEEVANNEPEDSQPLTTASIWLGRGDEDWFHVKAPDTADDYIIQVDEKPDRALRYTLEAYSADFSRIGASGALSRGIGQERTTYITVGPGTRTWLKFFAAGTGDNPRTEIRVDVRPSGDGNEPNNTRKTAKSIDLNTPITAWMVNGQVSKNKTEGDDYYSVKLEAGKAVFKLKSVPTNIKAIVEMVSEADGSVERHSESGPGVYADLEFNPPAKGTYVFRVHSAIGSFFTAAEEHLTVPYVFSIEQ